MDIYFENVKNTCNVWGSTLLHHSEKDLGLRPGPFCAELIYSPRACVGLSGYSKLSVGVIVSVNGCWYASPVMIWQLI